MNWRIVTDSSCDYQPDRPLPENLSLSEVPFIIQVGDREFCDTPGMNVPDMLDAMESCADASRTNCPSPGAWYTEFEPADYVIAITISANLSGSYNSAMSARTMLLEQHPEKNIFVLDSRSAGSALAMYVEKAIEAIEAGMDFAGVVAALQSYAAERHTIFALCSFNNLVKNGRVSKLSGFLASKLKVWGIGIASDIGTIIVKKKVHGLNHILNAFVEDMQENGFSGGYVIISHCENPVMAHQLSEKITLAWPGTTVKYLQTGGLCSYYAEKHGIILSY